MAILTREQESFLKQHNISISSVFDATGLGKKDYRAVMKPLGNVVAIGVTPCQKNKHTLRTRSGHCVQCNPASLAFQGRYSEEAFVYVAGSLDLKLVKIGFASDVDQRLATLNELEYAGAADWECLYWLNIVGAGQVEFDAQTKLKQYASPTTYMRNGKTVDCIETFSCGAETAIETVREYSNKNTSDWYADDLVYLYQFENIDGDGFARKGVDADIERAEPLYRSERTSSDSISEQLTDLISPEPEPVSVVQRVIEKESRVSMDESQELLEAVCKDVGKDEVGSGKLAGWVIFIIFFIVLTFVMVLNYF